MDSARPELCGCWRKHLQETGGFAQRLPQPSGFAASSWGKLGFTSRPAFSRHKDRRQNHLPSLDPKTKGFQRDTRQQGSADCSFLWHRLSAQRWNSRLHPNTGKVEGAVRHPHQPTPGTLLPTHLLPTTPTRVPETPHLSACKQEMCWEFQRRVPSRGLCPVCGHSLLLCICPALRRQQSPSSSPWQGGGGALPALPIHGRGRWGIPAAGALAEEGFAKPDSYSSFRGREKLVIAPH